MIGIDIIKTSRMQRLMERFETKALLRFLTEEEMKLVKNPKTAAGFWAAKEAFSKAIATGIGSRCSFYDMKIYKEQSGAPRLALSRKLIREFNITDVALSITHDGEYAIAVVAVESSTPTNKIQEF
jgi:holo-[acyl-carrier protein] synthase